MRTLRYKKLLSLSKICSGLVLAAALGIFAGTRAFPRSLAVSSAATGRPEPRFAMVDKIEEGIGLLKTAEPLQFSPGQWQDVALAVLDTSTGKVTEHRIRIAADGTVMENDPTLPFRITWWNSFNSFIEVVGHPEQVVVANKFVVERSHLPEQKTLLLDLSAPEGDYTEMVYAPYSSAIHKEDVIKAGSSYLHENAAQALKDLRDRRVASRASPGALVADSVPTNLMEALVLTEHVDPGWFDIAEDGGKTLVERALVIIGANREWAYRYTNSPAGANGLAQFIRPTYDALVKAYPSARLITDYRLGMADHMNAFKAVALLADWNAHEIPHATPAMLAAAYNGGPDRVLRARHRDGEAWATSNALAPETIQYIKKFNTIIRYEY